MNTLGMTGSIIDTINAPLNFIFLWGGLIIILGYPFYYFVRKFKTQINDGKNLNFEVFPQTLLLLVLAIIIGALWILPELITSNFPQVEQLWPPILTWFPTLLRWVELSFILMIVAYLFGHKYGEKRWLYSSVGHIAVILFGLIIDRWVGILFISLPILLAYYHILYRLAVIIVPASNPEDHAEKRKRFIVLVSYTWGIQYPLMIVDGLAWNKVEMRIPGDFTRDLIPVPGLVWTRAHQVISITGGIQFKRIDGPGVVFTGYMERPEQVFDLRLQLRTNEIDVVSKDGISFIARIFTGFRMDPETWDKEVYDKLRPMNTLLRGADKPSYTKGSFPYSNLRVQSALGVTSTKADTGNSTIYWDQWAINVVEDQARKVISQKKLDELWRPAEDEKFANAMDSIAKEIKERAGFALRSAGVLLMAARVVGFRFPKNDKQADEISEQQLATWGAEWERKRDGILSEANAESEHAQQAARAYAEEIMLNSIVESLQKTKEMDPRLPQYVIAMRFLSALQEHIRQRPTETDGEENTEPEKKTTELYNHSKEGLSQFLPRSGKEK